MDDEQLIQLVKIHPELYDNSNGKYLNSYHKENVWTMIGEKLDQPSASCKTRWSNIRDNYRKSEFRNNKKYKYGELLHFLKPHLEGHVISKERKSEVKHKTKKICKKPTVKASEENTIQRTNVPLLPVKWMLKEKTEPQIAPPTNSEVVVDTFLASIGSVLKMLTPYHLNLAKTKIFSTVQEIELQMLLQQAESLQNSSMPTAFSPGSDCSPSSNNSFLSNLIPETIIKSSPKNNTDFYDDHL